MRLLIVGIVAVFTLGCASPSVTMKQYMTRARTYDKGNFGTERSPAYQNCYTGFMAYLLSECKKHVKEDGATVWYWPCADRALDQMEECTDLIQ